MDASLNSKGRGRVWPHIGPNRKSTQTVDDYICPSRSRRAEHFLSRNLVSRNPSGDPCDFLSSSVTDLKRILQGIALFPWGNEEFLEETCNWEVSWILTRFETRCCSEDTLLSIPFELGSWSGGTKILEETCNWEVIRNLTRLMTRLYHDPLGFFTEER